MTELFDKGQRYDSTRQAWQDIWQTASVEAELQTMQYRRAQQTLHAYLPYLNKQDVILEAGSGLSAAVITLREMGYAVIGLDYAVNALLTSRHHTPDLPLVGGDVHELPFADNQFGAYLSFGVLEHFEHGMQPALQEAYRVLKPGGVLVMTIPYPNIVHELVRWRRQRAGETVLNDDDFYESTYTRQNLVDQVTAVGFDAVATLPTSHSFTLWGASRLFRAKGYYKTNALAEVAGDVMARVLPWSFNFMTLVIGRK